MRENGFESFAALFQPAGVLGGVRVDVAGADIAAVNDEDDGVADLVVTRPHAAEGVLPAYVPDLQVHVWEGYGRHILSYGWDCRF